jgi:hypothetical protein
MDAKLIEPSAKYFLQNTLQKCHEKRVGIYTTFLNIGVFVLFVGIVGGILYYNYRNRPTEYEKYQKMLKDQEYVLSKIKYYKTEYADPKYSHITNLPVTSELYI